MPNEIPGAYNCVPGKQGHSAEVIFLVPVHLSRADARPLPGGRRIFARRKDPSHDDKL
jgi:hypothetical protein